MQIKYWPGCPNSPKTEILYHLKPLSAELGIKIGGKYIIGDLQKVCQVSTSSRSYMRPIRSISSIQENSTQSDLLLEGSNELLVLMEFQINVYLLDF